MNKVWTEFKKPKKIDDPNKYSKNVRKNLNRITTNKNNTKVNKTITMINDQDAINRQIAIEKTRTKPELVQDF